MIIIIIIIVLSSVLTMLQATYKLTQECHGASPSPFYTQDIACYIQSTTGG